MDELRHLIFTVITTILFLTFAHHSIELKNINLIACLANCQIIATIPESGQ
jgi:hypothetical protein